MLRLAGPACCQLASALAAQQIPFCRFPRCPADHALFHAPYNKLVQKAFARLMYHDICK